MSGLQPITWEKSSLQTTLEGTQETRLRSIPRLKMQPSSTPLGGCSHKIRATELPTVPKPRIATFITQPSHRRNQPQSKGKKAQTQTLLMAGGIKGKGFVNPTPPHTNHEQ